MNHTHEPTDEDVRAMCGALGISYDLVAGCVTDHRETVAPVDRQTEVTRRRSRPTTKGFGHVEMVEDDGDDETA